MVMEIVFVVLCTAGGLALAMGFAFVLGKMKWAKKLPKWAIELVAAVIALAGLFAGFWFADAYKQSVIEQEYEQSE